MKLGSLVLAGLVSASDEDRKVPPRHPLQRLDRLVEFSGEILNSGSFNNKGGGWIRNWSRKFKVNGERMEKAFTRGQQRCGYYDNEQ